MTGPIPDDRVYMVQALAFQQHMGSGAVSVYVAKETNPEEYSLDQGTDAGFVFVLPDGTWMADRSVALSNAGLPLDGVNPTFPTDYEAVRYLVDSLPPAKKEDR